MKKSPRSSSALYHPQASHSNLLEGNFSARRQLKSRVTNVKTPETIANPMTHPKQSFWESKEKFLFAFGIEIWFSFSSSHLCCADFHKIQEKKIFARNIKRARNREMMIFCLLLFLPLSYGFFSTLFSSQSSRPRFTFLFLSHKSFSFLILRIFLFENQEDKNTLWCRIRQKKLDSGREQEMMMRKE